MVCQKFDVSFVKSWQWEKGSWQSLKGRSWQGNIIVIHGIRRYIKGRRLESGGWKTGALARMLKLKAFGWFFAIVPFCTSG